MPPTNSANDGLATSKTFYIAPSGFGTGTAIHGAQVNFKAPTKPDIYAFALGRTQRPPSLVGLGAPYPVTGRGDNEWWRRPGVRVAFATGD